MQPDIDPNGLKSGLLYYDAKMNDARICIELAKQASLHGAFLFNYTSLVSIDTNLKNKKDIEKIVLIKVPTEIYPSLYETFVFLLGKAGLKNIDITKKVDFEKLYNEKNKS